MKKRNILTVEWRERAEEDVTKQSRTDTHSLVKGCWLTGRVYTPSADFAEAVGKTYDISTEYGVDINRGLEGCLSLTVKDIAAEGVSW